MPKVSIIIPFNNVEGYIEECLNSVLTQTFEDIEVICINDASTDKTVDIVKSFKQKDKRIKLIELDERKGQGYARNRGIEIASGDYIGFVDSDDFIKPEMFEKLYSAALQANSEITMCQALEYDDVTGQYIDSDYYSLAPLYGFKDGVFSAEDTKNVILDINVALWNKIYKRSYLLDIGEKFPEGFIYEDLPFFFGTYLSAKRIKIVWESFYNYRINRKNSTMQQFNNKILDRPPMVSLTYEKMKKAHFLDDMQKVLQGWIINDLFHRYTLLKEHYQKEFFFLMKKVFQNLEIENINDDYWKRVYHFEGYLLVVNNTFEDFSQRVFNEYLDIHKVEDRLRSQIIDYRELDRRFGLIYDDLNKVYKYCEQIVSESQKKVTEEITAAADKKNEETNSRFLKMRQEFEIEKQNYQNVIENLKLEYKSMLQEQELKREEEKAELKNQIAELQNQIKEFKLEIREEMKSPIRKLIEKYKNKQGK